LVISDVKITRVDGSSVEYRGVGSRTLKVIAPGMPILLEMESALGTPMGFIVLQQGMAVEYLSPVAVTSQIDATSGKIKKTNPADEDLPPIIVGN
jgi:hypothetical protein